MVIMESHSSLAVRSGTKIAPRSRSCGQDHAVSRTSPRPPNHLWMAPALRETYASTDHQPANDRWRSNKCRLGRNVECCPTFPVNTRNVAFAMPPPEALPLAFFERPKQEFEVPLTKPVSDRMHARCRLSVTAVKRQRRVHTHARNTAHAGLLRRMVGGAEVTGVPLWMNGEVCAGRQYSCSHRRSLGKRLLSSFTDTRSPTNSLRASARPSF